MIEKFANHIHKKLPFLKGKKLLIAISGGVDSVVLTHLLNGLSFDISLAHCNFHLREKESDLDEIFVIDLGKKLEIQTFTKDIQIKTTSAIQLAARELRYQWFNTLIKEYKFDFVLTAHHADDNLETFLINLARGTGLEGFTGIPEINKAIARPLLPFSRSEIINFAKENKINWREDQSNATRKYVRNKIRHDVVPVLKSINPNMLDAFLKTVENLQESNLIIKDRIAEISKKIITKHGAVLKFDISKIKELSSPKAYLYELLKDYHFTEWNDVHNLLNAQAGKHVFSKTHVLLKDRDFLILSERILKNEENTTYLIKKNDTKITIPVGLIFEEVSIIEVSKKHVIYVDKTKISFPLIIRKWENGDVFYPAGMHGKKKLSKYFKDEKISLLEKKQIWLLCNNNNEIIWVINKRQDQRFISNKLNTAIKIKTYN